MQVLWIVSGLFYVAVMPVLFISWLEFFYHDRDNLTIQQQRVSMLIIAIATLFWIVALPFAYLELLDKFKRSSRSAQLYQGMLNPPKSQPFVPDDEIRFSNL